jgi:hypothetical protein
VERGRLTVENMGILFDDKNRGIHTAGMGDAEGRGRLLWMLLGGGGGAVAEGMLRLLEVVSQETPPPPFPSGLQWTP